MIPAKSQHKDWPNVAHPWVKHNRNLGSCPDSQPPEHREQEIDREQPNKNHLPEAQVASRPMIGHHFRIAIESRFRMRKI